jgi:aminopeptidase
MDARIEKYCDLIVKYGVNIQKNQTLFISSSVANAGFVRMITKKAFAAGAGDVVVDWNDEELKKLRFMNAKIEVFKFF